MTDPLAALTAAVADRYVIDRELGRGGMATVYLARDLKHERFVALKTLRPEIALALGPERFLREIKLAARLQHPNILAVYDSGDANGTLYYVMPFVEGESLRDRLDREPQLPLDDALQITREVADALAYAHSHDVVHRDIKPENILLSGGHAIVADFGIARAITAAGGDKLTETGLAIGTPAYMSPEQASGMRQVDRRSDIYSLACVLYETLAGQPPFTGPTAQAIMARHSLDHVPRLKIVREAIPDALEQVIDRALAKVPADRHQTAAQFAEALTLASTGTVSRLTGAPVVAARPRAWRKPAAIAAGGVLAAAVAWLAFGPPRNPRGVEAGGFDPRDVAVLYFADFSRDSSLGHLADGLSEGLIGELSQVRALRVVSSNGVAPYRGAEPDSVARALGVGSVIEGSVEPVGDRVRVTVRLVDGASGADIERASMLLPAAQLLAVRDSVVGEVTRLLRQRLGEEVELKERRAGTASVEAWTLVQRAEKARREAEGALARGTTDVATAAVGEADSLLAAAERADPRWVDPVILRGHMAALAARAVTVPRQRAERLREGLAHAARAVRLAPGTPRALEVRATLRYLLSRPNVEPEAARREALLDSAQADLEAAVGADPTLATAYARLSRLHYERKDVVSAVLTARAAYAADAYLRDADVILERLFWGSYDIAQFAEARRWCGEGARRFPGDWRFAECRLWMMLTPDAEADVTLAWRLARAVDSLTPARQLPLRSRLRQLLVGGVIGRAGLRDSAERVIVRARSDDAAVDPTQELLGYEAVVRAQLRDADRAIALLQRYVATHPNHSFQRGGMLHWWWQNLREHPGFQAVLAATR